MKSVAAEAIRAYSDRHFDKRSVKDADNILIFEGLARLVENEVQREYDLAEDVNERFRKLLEENGRLKQELVNK